MSTTRTIAAAAVLLGVGVMLAAPSIWKVRNHGSQYVRNRSVTLYSDTLTPDIRGLGGSVEIETAGLLITVGETVLSINDKTVGTVPAETRHVEVTVEKGNVSIAADGAEVPLRDCRQPGRLLGRRCRRV